MLRYKLRTLLIVLALGPPARAVAGMAAAGMRVHPVLLRAAVDLSLVLTLITASRGLEAAEQSRLARFVPWRTLRLRIELFASNSAEIFGAR